jgi:hypothetical protein
MREQVAPVALTAMLKTAKNLPKKSRGTTRNTDRLNQSSETTTCRRS